MVSSGDAQASDVMELEIAWVDPKRNIKMTNYRTENHGDVGRTRDGSPTFYKLLEEMADIHDRKSHDYASNDNPYGNYYFAGEMAMLFSHSPQDAGFVGRIAEKIYRLSALERMGKIPKNEAVEDTERDIATITALWMASRRDRRGRSADKLQWGNVVPSDSYQRLASLIMKLDNTELAKLELYVMHLREKQNRISKLDWIKDDIYNPNEIKEKLGNPEDR